MAFEEQLARFLAGAEVKLARQANQQAAKLTLELSSLAERFWTIFVSKTIGAASTPDYVSGYGGGWAPLTEKYVRRKGHNRFYDKTGALRDYLMQLDYKQVFGSPKVFRDYVIKGSGDVNTARDEFEIRERAVVRYRNALGRFVSKRDARWKEFTGSYRIVEFPNLKRAPKTSISAEAMAFDNMGGPGAEMARNKLSNPKGKRLRPALGYYMLWWRDQMVLNIAKKYGKVVTR